MDNPRAPTVELLEPADGDVVPAGRPVRVRATSADAELLWVALDGSVTWVVDQATMEAVWRPSPGRHVLVVGAEMTGMPGALDDATITVRAAAAGAPAEPEPGSGAPGAGSPPGGATPAPGAASVPGPTPRAAVPFAARPGAPARAGRSEVGTPLRGGGGVAPPATRAPGDATPPPAAGPAPGAPSGPAATAPPSAGPLLAGGAPRTVSHRPDDGWNPLHGGRRGLIAAGLPLLLLAALVAYALLQRFVDGGRKLAWRGRHEPDDVVVEF